MNFTQEELKVIDLIKILYSTMDGGAGGYGHIVFDDYNIETPHIDWCIIEAEKGDYALAEETRMASLNALKAIREIESTERRLQIVWKA